MFFAEVTRLHGPGGERLPLGRRGPPLRGTVVISEMHRVPDRKERYVVAVDMYEEYGTPRMRSLASMFDPTILPNAKGEGFLMAGYQRECEFADGKQSIKEHRQVWLCVPVVP